MTKDAHKGWAILMKWFVFGAMLKYLSHNLVGSHLEMNDFGSSIMLFCGVCFVIGAIGQIASEKYKVK